MKTLRLILLLAISTGLCTSSFAQFSFNRLSVSPGFTLHQYAGENIPSQSLAINLRAGYDLGEKSVLLVGFEYGLPTAKRTIWQNPSTDGKPQMGAQMEYGLQSQEVQLGYQYYLLGQHQSGFGLYGVGGLSYSMTQVKNSRLSAYIPNPYTYYNINPDPNPQNGFSFKSPEEKPTSNHSLGLQAGLGAVYRKSRLSWFAELKGSLPLSQNKLYGEIIVSVPEKVLISEHFPPLSLGLTAGCKINLGK